MSTNRYRTYFRRSIVFLAMASLIVAFLPRSGHFNYQYSVGKPWQYGLLIAPLDFTLYKDAEAVAMEQREALRKFRPYFNRRASVGKAMIAQMRDDLKEKSTPDCISHIEKLLHRIYDTGVVAAADWERIESKGQTGIMIIRDNVATAVGLDNLTTPRRAYLYLLDNDTLHYKVELLQSYDLDRYVTSNLELNKQKTDMAQKELLADVSVADGYVMKGQKIIDRGEIVDEHTAQILTSMKAEMDTRQDSHIDRRLTLLGQFLFVAAMLFCLCAYLLTYRVRLVRQRGVQWLIGCIFLFFPIIASLVVQTNFTSIYVVPFVIAPVVLRVFLDSRTAFLIHLLIVLISSIVLTSPYEFLLIQLVAGLAAIYSLHELSQRSQILRTALCVFLAYAVVYTSYELIMEQELTQFNTYMYVYFLINAIVFLFTYPLLFIIEKTFGFVSEVTLVELSNTNNSLLRRLSEEAPGTSQHSMQVANLAAAAAQEVDANVQLVRTAALYHDIGKLENPVFFTENQTGVNPHQQLTNEESARIIIGHIADGLALAESYHLPESIRSFIRTHHGRGLAKYFYVQYKNAHPDEEVDVSRFSYPGPNPSTKEQAILMMADAVEAASRSLSSYTEASIGTLVNRLIDAQMAEGYFTNCPITFSDIFTIKRVLKEKLMTMYHTRISYPELKK
ncbi:MAG: HDIG domain-containing protein [Bacteroidales bacterium]|nr:HDIG domain-containing protein [Bacteroidales bacterium]